MPHRLNLCSSWYPSSAPSDSTASQVLCKALLWIGRHGVKAYSIPMKEGRLHVDVACRWEAGPQCPAAGDSSHLAKPYQAAYRVGIRKYHQSQKKTRSAAARHRDQGEVYVLAPHPPSIAWERKHVIIFRHAETFWGTVRMQAWSLVRSSKSALVMRRRRGSFQEIVFKYWELQTRLCLALLRDDSFEE